MADDEYDLSDEDQETIETLTDEESSIIKSIDSLKKLEAGLAAKAQPVSAFAKRGVAPGAPAQAKKKGGSLFAKHVTAALFAKEHQVPLRDTIEQLYGNDDEVKATIGMTIEKSGIPAADTTTSGWAAELVQHDTEAFLEDLQPISIYAALRARGTGMNFNGMGSLKIPSRAASASPNNEMAGAWVGEGGVIPVKRGQITSQTLNPYKLAVISAWTNELDARAVPAIEAMVRKMILDDTAKTLDGYLFDAVGQVNGVRPAGLLNNVTLTAATAGSTAAGIITDLKVLFGKMAAAGVGANPVMVCNSLRLLGLSTITTAAGGFMFRDEVAAGRLLGVPVISAEHFPANTVAIVDANSFVGANDTPMFAVSDQATLTMANADLIAPTQAQDGAGAIGGIADQVAPKDGIHVNSDLTDAANVGAQAVSLFQTYQTAIRMVLPTGWGMTRGGTVAGLSGVNW